MHRGPCRIHVPSLLVLLSAVLVGASACTVPLPNGPSGSIAMAPFVDEAYGIRGLAPAGAWSERAVLVQQSAPAPMDEVVAAVLEQTDLVALPRSLGSYQGRALTWALYKFETQLAEADPGIYRVDIALAEHNGTSYLVVLVTLPTEYGANPRLYRTAFEHALRAFAPLEQAGD